MSGVLHRTATRDGLTAALGSLPVHLHPFILAMRDHGTGFMFVPQVATPFRAPRDGRPTIFVLGDDFEKSAGPDAFHMPSVRRAIRSSQGFAVVAGAPLVDVYSGITVTAVAMRDNVMVIETQPEHEIQWVSLIQKLAPGRVIWLSTVKGARN